MTLSTRLVAGAFLALLTVQGAAAQSGKGETSVIVTGGGSWFLDDDSPTHGTVGGSVRAYLTDRIAIEPELLYLRASPTDQDYVFAGSVVYHLRDSSRRAKPFVAGGVGALHHKGPFRSSTDLTGIAGGGVRIDLTDRIFFEPRFRMGIEPNFYWLLTGSVGFVLTGR